MRLLHFEHLEPRLPMSVSPLDVNGDGVVTPIDAKFLIESLNDLGPRKTTDGDVNGDGWRTAADALAVISALNRPLEFEQVPLAHIGGTSVLCRATAVASGVIGDVSITLKLTSEEMVNILEYFGCKYLYSTTLQIGDEWIVLDAPEKTRSGDEVRLTWHVGQWFDVGQQVELRAYIDQEPPLHNGLFWVKMDNHTSPSGRIAGPDNL